MTRKRLAPFLITLLLAAPRPSYAGPGGAPLIGFGQTILDFLTGPLAIVVLGLGIAIAAVSMIMGSREGMQKAIFAIIGGGLLFSVHAIVDFVASAAR